MNELLKKNFFSLLLIILFSLFIFSLALAFQQMSGYLIAQLNMTDKESFKLYAETVPESVKKFGGKYLVRAGEFKSMQGKWDFTRNVIIEFPTYEKALEWYNSDLYKPLKELRQKGSEGNIIIIKGA